jgi:hypothetical protein
MIFNIDYKDAVELRNAGINTLIKNLGEENAAKFIALFNYYTINTDSEDLLIKDYTEWRKTQSWYNDITLDELLQEAAEAEIDGIK